MQKIARERGFEGRLVIMGEPEIAPVDARLEWADGGVVREGAAIGAALAEEPSRRAATNRRAQMSDEFDLPQLNQVRRRFRCRCVASTRDASVVQRSAGDLGKFSTYP